MKKSQYMSPSEVEFIAEHSVVTILPNFQELKLNFLTGDFGPFTPGLPVEVPLWMAVNLKQRHKCRIHTPDWMNVEKLEQVKETEVNEQIFSPPPSKHYMEISAILFRHAPEDIPKADEVRTLIKDIYDIRMAKLRKSVDQMVLRQETHAEISNLTILEMNQVRSSLLPALNKIHDMRCYVVQLPNPGTL